MQQQRKGAVGLIAIQAGVLMLFASCYDRATITTGGNANEGMLQPPGNGAAFTTETSLPKAAIFAQLANAANDENASSREHVVALRASEHLNDINQCVWWFLPDGQIPPSDRLLPCRRIALCDDERYGCRIAIDALIWMSDEGLVGCLELREDKTTLARGFTVDLLAANLHLSRAVPEEDQPALHGTIMVIFRGPRTEEHCGVDCDIRLGAIWREYLAETTESTPGDPAL